MDTMIKWTNLGGGYRSKDGRYRVARDMNYGDWKLLDLSKSPSDPERILGYYETARAAKASAEELA